MNMLNAVAPFLGLTAAFAVTGPVYVALGSRWRTVLLTYGLIVTDASLAMMDARIRRRRTLEAVKRIIIHESLKQPLVVIFEETPRQPARRSCRWT
jgi:hypothetical protein